MIYKRIPGISCAIDPSPAKSIRQSQFVTFLTLAVMRVMLSMFIVDLWKEEMVTGRVITAEIFI